VTHVDFSNKKLKICKRGFDADSSYQSRNTSAGDETDNRYLITLVISMSYDICGFQLLAVAMHYAAVEAVLGGYSREYEMSFLVLHCWLA